MKEYQLTLECNTMLAEEDFQLLIDLENALGDNMVISEAVAGFDGKIEEKLRAVISYTKETAPRVAKVLLQLLHKNDITIYRKNGEKEFFAQLPKDALTQSNIDKLVEVFIEWLSNKN